MGRKTGAELLVDVLAEAGVERIYGAGAGAHLPDKLVVCAGSCGPALQPTSTSTSRSRKSTVCQRRNLSR
jgi:hypothetical protein